MPVVLSTPLDRLRCKGGHGAPLCITRIPPYDPFALRTFARPFGQAKHVKCWLHSFDGIK